MSYTIYKTTGIVLSRANHRESNQIIQFFTKDFGLIRASVQNVRSISSKMRYGLNTFSYANIDLVKGKEFWRVTGVDLIKSGITFSGDPHLKVLSNISSLLKEFLIEEEKSESLFEIMEMSLNIDNSEFAKKFLEEYEMFLVINILDNLGYWDNDFENLFNRFNLETVEFIKKNKKDIIKRINSVINGSLV